MINTHILVITFLLFTGLLNAQNAVQHKPRILISTDIGGTDPDDNQSMTHLLMYNDCFQIEGLVSSPSYGEGSKAEIMRMIDLYEKDLPHLQKHATGWATPDYLRSVTKQGRKGAAPFKGYQNASEGSDWIIKCAKETQHQPLWILVWGALDDLAQALHDAPEIEKQIKVYWIGGPNKKWSANSYAYLVENFPDLWFIEVNSSYYGFFSNSEIPDSIKTSNYYQEHIQGAGYLAYDFQKYYRGEIKMGDTPSVLYMMDGNPENPLRESWGGSFEKINHSPRTVFHGPSGINDTVAFCSILEFHLQGPEINIPKDSACFLLELPYGKTIQKWPGYYLGNGNYAVRYVPKKAETLHYRFTSEIKALNGLEGSIVVANQWPGKKQKDSYPLGQNWYSDKSNPLEYHGQLQGGKTLLKWRNEVLKHWAERWKWLR